ncbi:hypothetical protein AVEN_44378-1 [Araneus ventricosus]|uniref:Uncharacterized protein n=1 Tax=Araneus ventricosus TaxID=182803 RepID=A0A4Y2QRP0_ARAVE|nr:hypothetical protein AVEN_44378-1 [Araneus ventricosus]
MLVLEPSTLSSRFSDAFFFVLPLNSNPKLVETLIETLPLASARRASTSPENTCVMQIKIQTGAAIRFKGDRKDQTALALLLSGHLKTLRFSRGDKKFNISTKCNMIEATPQHLLDCVALVYDDLLKRPDFVLEVMKANDLMDLIQIKRIRDFITINLHDLKVHFSCGHNLCP